MLDVFNFPNPQSANYQEFYAGGGGGANTDFSWVKPRGVSMVRFMLIGGGGGGNNGTASAGGAGGGSGAVTSWIGPAIFIPDQLVITPGLGGDPNTGGTTTSVRYLKDAATGYYLLTANAGSANGTAGTAMTRNAFAASGIFTSIAGQAGASGSSTASGTNQTASATTFLSGGAGGAGGAAGTGGSVTPNYGYTALSTTTAGGSVKGADGYFITQPILVGTGGAGGTTSTSVGTAGGRGGIGCGGGGSGEDGAAGGRGGNGAVFIWAW